MAHTKTPESLTDVAARFRASPAVKPGATVRHVVLVGLAACRRAMWLSMTTATRTFLTLATSEASLGHNLWKLAGAAGVADALLIRP